MEFELLDGYLLRGTPQKGDVIKTMLALPVPVPAAAGFYAGLRMLGDRTPDLSLIALRLVLAGRKADDDAVIRLRGLAEAARSGGAAGAAARANYFKELS